MSWKTFTIDNNIYMLKFTNDNGLYKINISDLNEFWWNEYNKETLIQEFQKSNPTILLKVEESEETLLQIQSFFDKIEKADVTITKDNANYKIDVTIKTEILGLNNSNFNIKYKFELIKADQNKFKEEIIVPMVYTIHYLENQKKMLCNIIKNKDRELEEYNIEKGSISRLDLITEKFNLNTVENSPSEKLMLNVYSQSKKFWETFVNEHGNIESNIKDISRDSWNHVKKKKKIYNSATAAKRTCKDIFYKDK